GAKALDADQSWPAGAAVHACELPARNRLAATSWEHLLAVLREALTVAGGATEMAGLGSVDRRGARSGGGGCAALGPGGTPARVGRQLSELVPALHRAAQEVSAARLRNGSGDHGAGRHITTTNGHSLWVGVWLACWGRYGHSPAWVQLRASKGIGVDALAEALA